MTFPFTDKLSEAYRRLQAGDILGAQTLCHEVLAGLPRHSDALILLGIVHLAAGRAREAVSALEQALAASPQHGAALENLGLARLMLGEFAEAERTLHSAAGLPGAPASVFMRLGLAMLNQGRHAQAVEALEHALELDPREPDIHLNLAQAVHQSGDTARARQHFQAVLNLAPDRADAAFNLGVLCLQDDELDSAQVWLERALATEPKHADAVMALGVIREKQGRLDEAVTYFRRALDYSPQLAQAGNNLAHCLALQGKAEEAHAQYLATLRIAPNLIEACEGLAFAALALGSRPGRAALLDNAIAFARRAQALDPTLADPYFVLAYVYALRGEHADAVTTLEAGHARTNSSKLLGTLAFELRHLCEWSKWQEAWQKMLPLLEQDVDFGNPFMLLCQPTTAKQQFKHACRWSAAHRAITQPVQVKKSSRAHDRLRIGYLSSDFGEHAVSSLLVEVLELHDRKNYEVFAYSSYPDDGGLMRQRVRKASEHFIDIANDNDDIAAARIRDDQLDILVDLNGYTKGIRVGVLARRPCAIQASWIGYPGTMGADFIDYLIADNFVIPPGHEDAYSEKVLRLPHSYLPSDRQREVATPLTRAKYGLPEEGFVFCCFNQAYKFTPEVFACWMQLLREVPHSVLWLPHHTQAVTNNLVNVAQALGVASERLRFAPRVKDAAQHLARYRAADLALDTFPYTSHTTAIDALWAGCLLVGLCGNTFASRASGSILSACQLPELVTYSLADYERLALRLATDKPFRNGLRAKLQANKLATPLFDSLTFTRDLENIYHNIAAKTPTA